MAIAITRDEYNKKYGIDPVIPESSLDTNPAPIEITRAEYEARYNPKAKAKKPTVKDPYIISTAKDAPSDIWETLKNVIDAGKMGRDKFGEAFTTPDLSPTQRLAGAVVAPFQGVARGLGEVAVGGAKLFTTDEFEKNLAEKVGEEGIKAIESETGQTIKEFYDGLDDQNKYNVTNIFFPVAEVAGEAFGWTKAQKAFSETANVVDDALSKVDNALPTSVDKKVQKVADEIKNIENNYAKLRNKNNFTPDDGDATRKMIAQADVLQAGDVDIDGTLRTTVKGGAVDRFYNNYLKGYEDVVRTNLVNEGASISMRELRDIMTREIGSTKGLEGADLISAINGIENELKGLSLRANALEILPLQSLHDAKIATTKHINYATPPETKTYRKALARVYKEVIENKSKTNVKATNAELAKRYKAIEKLQDLDGRKVKGGRLGKYTASLSGNIIGAVGGSALGPVGSFAGSVVGGEVASSLKGKAMSSTFGRGTGSTLPPNTILETAKATARAGKKVDLKVPDKAVGVPKGIPKTKTTSKLEGQIKRNVAQQKKAIKAKDFTLVAKLKEVYQLLVDALKKEVQWIKENMKSEAGFANFGGGKAPDLKRQNAKGDIAKSARTPEEVVVDMTPDDKPFVQAMAKGEFNPLRLKKAKEDFKLGKNASDEQVQSYFKEVERELDKRWGDLDKSATTKTTDLGTPEEDLFAIHNTSSENLARIMENNSMPAPSIAITSKDVGFDKFGEISLVGNAKLIDPSNPQNKAFGGDIYSIRPPKPQYDLPPRQEISALAKKYNMPLNENDIGRIVAGDLNKDYVLDKTRFWDEADPEGFANEVFKNPHIELKKDTPDGLLGSLVEEDEVWADLFKDSRDWDDFELTFSNDEYLNQRLIEEAEQRYGGDGWDNLDKIVDEIEEGFKEKAPYTGDNVVRSVEQQLNRRAVDVRNSEGWPAPIRVQGYQQFKSIDEIRQNKNLLVDEVQADKIGLEREGKWEKFINSLDLNTTKYADMDSLVEEVVQSKKFSDTEYLKKQLGIKSDKDARKAGVLIKNAYYQVPTSYFEVKAIREVSLDEFDGALVPKSLPDTQKKQLQNKGIKIVEYTDNKDRLKKLAQFSGSAFGIAVIYNETQK